MTQIADELETLGFRVPERRPAAEVGKKMVGYVLDERRPVFRVPLEKSQRLQQALFWLAGFPVVDTGLLHSVVGVWLWAALLRRPALSAISTLFTFLERVPKQRVVVAGGSPRGAAARATGADFGGRAGPAPLSLGFRHGRGRRKRAR